MSETKSKHSADDSMNMGVKAYNVIILIADIIVLLTTWLYLTLESILRKIIPAQEVDVTGAIVLVTGSGHGIGKQLSLQYARCGAILVCVDINEQSNKETVKEIQARGGRAYPYVCDVTSREKCSELQKIIEKEVGIVSILVNNAGIMPAKTIMQQSETEIRKTFDINVLAHLWLIQAFLPGMISQNKGHIVALSSVAGLAGLRNIVPYCGSKFAVRGMMEALSEELRPMNVNIKCTVVYPYMVDTGLCKKPYIRFKNLMKLLTPDEVAENIIKAQRRGLDNVTVPKVLMYVNNVARLFPTDCGRLLADFMDSGVESEEQ
ncbi:17-beta-hydroxysteroid dehydrogenase 13 [Bradysia coprophila]|uniref:17-beta-hydroxysteroid dehydrogenase 13 n=1 Tax=Bradysia coprophila TaxID=38358 RepID=UPI00187D94C8|nr:17-beta-hydroxysteroid dehydrogenase 13 [Bradysia coprophila]